MAARNWTPEQRQQQAERIRDWSPWAQSTGPRTAEGKAAASRNGWKGGNREMLRELARLLVSQRHAVTSLRPCFPRAPADGNDGSQCKKS